MLANKIESQFPSEPVAWIDSAFFKIIDGDIKGAYKRYKKIQQYPFEDPGFFPDLSVDSLESAYDYSGEPAFLYGAGLLSMLFVDKSRGREMLNRFLKESSDRHKLMCKEAQKLLQSQIKIKE